MQTKSHPARTWTISILCLALGVSLAVPHTASAHEYWLEPHTYRLDEPGKLTGDLKNGQNFKAGNNSYLPSRFEFFNVIGPEGTEEVKGRSGDRPALNHELTAAGFYTISYQGKFDRITFTDPEKLKYYFEYEGLTDAMERHLARGLTEERFEEKYARSVKALVQVGPVREDGRQDELTGLTFELVAEKNPYSLTENDALPVRLFYKGEPTPDTQIRIFRFDGELENTTIRTDDDGRALIPLRGGGKFLLNAVRLYEGDEDPDTETPHWFSDWASMVFGIAGTDELLGSLRTSN